MKNTKNTKIKKPIPKKVRKALSTWISIVMVITMMTLCTVTCFAAEDDPVAVVNNLSDFMFGLVRAVGMIYGIILSPGKKVVECQIIG